MSAGRRSGVNWTRRNARPRAAAKDFAIRVFASPGTSSMRTWPSLRTAHSTRPSTLEPTHPLLGEAAREADAGREGIPGPARDEHLAVEEAVVRAADRRGEFRERPLVNRLGPVRGDEGRDLRGTPGDLGPSEGREDPEERKNEEPAEQARERAQGQEQGDDEDRGDGEGDDAEGRVRGFPDRVDADRGPQGPEGVGHVSPPGKRGSPRGSGSIAPVPARPACA